MRVDLDYFSKILNVFLEAETAHISMKDIQESGITIGENRSFDEKFIFHIQLTIDNQLIARETGPAYNLEDLGLSKSMDGICSIWEYPIRLTQKGHDFSATLSNHEVIEKLKKEFKDAPFKVIFEGGQKLFQHYSKKKLDALLEE